MGNVAEKSRIIAVEVTDSRPSGIRVMLPDGRKGFIRPREVSWERRISIPNKLPEKGDVLEAVILPDESRGDLLFLSLRQCTDPWSEAISKQKYKVGQIVEGEVVNVRNTGAYIQVEPGVDGVITPKNAPILRGNTIEDVLWLGDKVSVIIDAINKENRLLELNLFKRLRKLPLDKDECKQHLLEYYGARHHPQNVGSPVANLKSDKEKVEKRFVRSSIRRLDRILIVDNEDNWLDYLCEGLEKEYKVKVDGVHSGAEALKGIQEEKKYSLIALDLHLKDELGTSVAERIQQFDPKIPLLIMSAFELDEDGAPLVENGYPFCYKSLEDLIQKTDELRNGYWHISQPTRLTGKDEQFIRQLGMQALSKRSPAEIFTNLLSWLYDQTEVSHCILLELDRTRQTGTIVSSYPPMAVNDLQFAQDGLYFSPARQVVEEEREFCDNMVDIEKDTKYKNFLTNLNFQSCIGIPIRIPDQTTRYALFLLEEAALGFSERDKEGAQRILHARMASFFLAIAIEHIGLLDYMRRYEERYSLGQLAAVMIHEMNNKMGAFETSVKNLMRQQTKRPAITKTDSMKEWLMGMDAGIQQISEIQGNLSKLVKSYARQAEGDFESVDVNELVSDVAFELGRTAERKGTELFLDMAKQLPPVRAIRSQLQQVVLNVMLNAVQMIILQREWAKHFGQQPNHYLPALQNGMIVVQTRHMCEKVDCPIEIRVIDNGPGIHWRDLERIFFAGVTRRGGAGLGLYISRNLVERMGGRLNLFDSTLFLGSAFTIELFPYENSEEKKWTK